MVEITSEEQNKVKRMKRNEGSLSDLWDNIKSTNIQIMGVPEDKEKKKKKKKEKAEKYCTNEGTNQKHRSPNK